MHNETATCAEIAQPSFSCQKLRNIIYDIDNTHYQGAKAKVPSSMVNKFIRLFFFRQWELHPQKIDHFIKL